MTTIRYFSMFSGIGGFELGIEQAIAELGITAECVGYSEIDKHVAMGIYQRTRKEASNGTRTRQDQNSHMD